MTCPLRKQHKTFCKTIYNEYWRFLCMQNQFINFQKKNSSSCKNLHTPGSRDSGIQCNLSTDKCGICDTKIICNYREASFLLYKSIHLLEQFNNSQEHFKIVSGSYNRGKLIEFRYDSFTKHKKTSEYIGRLSQRRNLPDT